MVLAWTHLDPSQVSIAEYASEDGEVLSDMLRFLTRSPRLHYTVMSSTLPDADRARFHHAGFRSEGSTPRNQPRYFLYYPLNPGAPLDVLNQDPSGFPEQWRVTLLDTMGA